MDSSLWNKKRILDDHRNWTEDNNVFLDIKDQYGRPKWKYAANYKLNKLERKEMPGGAWETLFQKNDLEDLGRML